VFVELVFTLLVHALQNVVPSAQQQFVVGLVSLRNHHISLVRLVHAPNDFLVLFALLRDPHQKRTQHFVFLEVVQVFGLNDRGFFCEIRKADVVELKLNFEGLAAHRVEFGFHEILVDLHRRVDAVLLVCQLLERCGVH